MAPPAGEGRGGLGYLASETTSGLLLCCEYAAAGAGGLACRQASGFASSD